MLVPQTLKIGGTNVTLGAVSSMPPVKMLVPPTLKIGGTNVTLGAVKLNPCEISLSHLNNIFIKTYKKI